MGSRGERGGRAAIAAMFPRARTRRRGRRILSTSHTRHVHSPSGLPCPPDLPADSSQACRTAVRGETHPVRRRRRYHQAPTQGIIPCVWQSPRSVAPAKAAVGRGRGTSGLAVSGGDAGIPPPSTPVAATASRPPTAGRPPPPPLRHPSPPLRRGGCVSGLATAPTRRRRRVTDEAKPTVATGSGPSPTTPARGPTGSAGSGHGGGTHARPAGLASGCRHLVHRSKGEGKGRRGGRVRGQTRALPPPPPMSTGAEGTHGVDWWSSRSTRRGEAAGRVGSSRKADRHSDRETKQIPPCRRGEGPPGGWPANGGGTARVSVGQPAGGDGGAAAATARRRRRRRRCSRRGRHAAARTRQCHTSSPPRTQRTSGLTAAVFGTRGRPTVEFRWRARTTTATAWLPLGPMAACPTRRNRPILQNTKVFNFHG